MSFARFENFIFEKMSETHLPGLAAAIVKGSEVIWARGFGYRDKEMGLPATPNTAFAIASITKSFTSLALMQLAEQGKLSLDDPVSKHIPFDIKPLGEAVLLRHFMTHTSGIPALAYAEAVIDYATGAGAHWLPVGGCDDLLLFMNEAAAWAINKPGEAHYYLNEGYALLGCVITAVSGVPYNDYITANILGPLGMERSYFDKAVWEADPEAATPYTMKNGERAPSTYAFGGLSADGALISTANDLAKYAAMYLNGGKYNGARVVSPESLAEMFAGRIEVRVENPLFGGRFYGYGLSTYPDFLGRRIVGHGGSVGTATSHLVFVPEEKLGIAVVSNGTGYPMQFLALYGLAAALGEDPDTLPYVRQMAALDALAGRYETYKGTLKIDVKRQGDFLALTFLDRHNALTVHIIPDDLDGERLTFYALAAGQRMPVEFRKQDGEVHLLYERYYLKRTGKL